MITYLCQLEQCQLSGIRAAELQSEDGAEATEVGTCLRQQVRIAGRIKTNSVKFDPGRNIPFSADKDSVPDGAMCNLSIA